jgi:hypothetical protein
MSKNGCSVRRQNIANARVYTDWFLKKPVFWSLAGEGWFVCDLAEFMFNDYSKRTHWDD